MLVFVLFAVWPATDFNPRLQLLSPVAVPTFTGHSTPPPAKIIWPESNGGGEVQISVEAAPPNKRHLKRQTSVHQTVPIYQRALLIPADAERHEAFDYELPLYISYCISQPAERGPPIPV